MKNAFYFIEYAVLRSFIFLIALIPFRILMKWAPMAGAALQRLLKTKNSVALENLRNAYGNEKSEAELQKVARESFVNLVRVFIEFIKIPEISKDPERYVHFHNQQRIWDALKQKRGLIMIISHFGNWELMAVRSAAEGLPMNAVARPLKNPFVYRYIKKLRECTGLHSVEKSGAARETMRLLGQNEVVCFLIDQRERQGGVTVDFFGQPCLTASLPAAIALRRNVPVIPAFHYRDPDGSTRLEVLPPFSLIQNGNEEEDIRSNTQEFIRIIEKEVRRDPANWLWMHRRWRI